MGIEKACTRTCRLYSNCLIKKESDTRMKEVEAVIDLNLHGLELAVRDEDDPELAAKYHDWVTRLEAKFAGDPEGLARALKSVGDLYGSTLDLRADNAKQIDKIIQDHNDYEAHRAWLSKSASEFLAVVASEGCEGPSDARAGFLWRKRIKVCNAPVSDATKTIIRNLFQTEYVPSNT